MVKIEKIIEQNKWWVLGEEFAIEDKQLRELNLAILKINRKSLELKKEYIHFIYGPRRIGKTTFIKKTILNLLKTTPKEKIAYFSCDDLVTNSKEELTDVLDFLLKRNLNYLFIDEINVVKNWVQLIRSYLDKGKFKDIAVVITGSPFGIKEMLIRDSCSYFMKPITFRDFVKDLTDQLKPEITRALGFSNEEFKILKNLNNEIDKAKFKTNLKIFYENASLLIDFLPIIKKLFDIYIFTGGFPSVINNYFKFKFYREIDYENKFNEEHTKIMEQLIDTLKKRGKSETIAKQIINALAEKMTSRYGFREITKATEEKTSQVTIIEYLHHLVDVFFIEILYSYDFNKKMPKWKGDKKIYFTDPFIFYSVKKNISGKEGIAIIEQLIEKSKATILETISTNLLVQTVAEPIIKNTDTFLWFYYTQKGKEIDFIYKKEDYLAIEIKSEKAEKPQKIQQIKNYIVVAENSENFSYEQDKGTVYLPSSLFFILLEKNEKHL